MFLSQRGFKGRCLGRDIRRRNEGFENNIGLNDYPIDAAKDMNPTKSLSRHPFGNPILLSSRILKTLPLGRGTKSAESSVESTESS